MFLDKLAVPVLQKACIGLAAGVVAMGILAGVQTFRLTLAKADARVAKADLASMTIERDAAAINAQDQARAAGSWKTVAAERLTLLQEAQAENTRLAGENRAAVAAAQAKARAAQADAAAWRRKHAALLASDNCQRAKAALEAACPVDSF